MKMFSPKQFCLTACLACLLVPALWLSDVHAVPSFKRQTGLSCGVCHTVFPELTPSGRDFKLNGYLFSKSTKPFLERIPVSAMVQLSYTEQRGLDNTIAPFDDSPAAKFNIPQQASLFYAGQIIGHLGAFSQLTYSGVGNSISLDNTDIRYANSTLIGETPLVYGMTVNNNPTLSDLWNTVSAWRYQYASSSVALKPAAGMVIDGMLAQKVGGAGLYALWNNLIYAEAAVYGSTRKGIASPLGAGTTVDTVVSGAMPYWRLAIQYQRDEQSFEIGTYGLVADIYPSGFTNGPTDRFTDYALDTQYQRLSGKHIFSTHMSWIWEKQDWDASFLLGNTANRSNRLETVNVNLNYFYKADMGTLGGIIAYFSTTGSTDTTLYTPSAVTGNSTGRPDSSGFILEANYLPMENLKLAVQYVIYDKFNGAGTNYDGFGRNASDNNTLYLLAWMAF
jgi:hypothetical protein